MGLFKLPSSLCHDIEMDMSRFWWGFGEEKRKIYWVAWRKMCKAKREGGMGFRHIETFNLAMLAKQGWRLIDKPDSLAARLLKARYFPNCDFLEATIGHHPSFVWRSILVGQDVLRQGCRWIVGNGKSVRIWADKWTFSQPSYKLLSPISGDPDARVADWIDDVSGRWKEDVVRRHLLRDEAEKILKMPISPGHEDKLAWHYTTDGVFSVRSGYHFARYLTEIAQGMEGPSVQKRDWCNLWKVRVPPKVKVFAWRACTGALPCGINLKKRVEVVDPTCCRCGLEPENELHALLFCSRVTGVWAEVGIDAITEWGSIQNLRDWFELLPIDNDELRAGKFMMVIWQIWNERNHIFHGGTSREPEQVVQTCLRLWGDYVEANTKENAVAQDKTGEIQWTAPSSNTYKINVDGAVLGERGSGAGVVIRGSEGEVLVSSSHQAQERWEPAVTEMKAAELGLKLARQFSLRDVVLESDCMQVVTMLRSKIFPVSYLGNLGRDVLLLFSDFQSVSVVHVRRQGNRAAHYMAHLDPLDYSVRVWIDGGPEGLLDVTSVDYMSAFIN